ncbi:hypothetical protein BD779DRAFT_1704849 [Infundibulicybe gibba]|nr:hypothetical protein BD779DRAFT_1704849 [Infundibulicybe gibba]
MAHTHFNVMQEPQTGASMLCDSGKDFEMSQGGGRMEAGCPRGLWSYKRRVCVLPSSSRLHRTDSMAINSVRHGESHQWAPLKLSYRGWPWFPSSTVEPLLPVTTTQRGGGVGQKQRSSISPAHHETGASREDDWRGVADLESNEELERAFTETNLYGL